MTITAFTPSDQTAAKDLAPVSTPRLEGVAGDRRGPLRPTTLALSRTRIRGLFLWRTYRLLDGLMILGLAMVAGRFANPPGLWASPTALVLPFFAAAGLLVGAVSSAGAYEFRRREGLAMHLARLGLGLAAFAAALLALLALARPPQAIGTGLINWFELCAAGLGLIHVGWWGHVRALRQSGRLTPNVVIVGATANAKRLIARALESRDVAVLGVFDDRKRRAPGDILGVPVLGDTGALVGHKIMPYVDQVIITVTASAQSRVRDLVEHLRVIPNEITLFVDVEMDHAPAAALSRVADAPLARLSGHRAEDGRALAKRLQDIVLAVVALAAAAPVMIAVAVAIKLDTPGPVFFRQRRQGFNNEDIVVWKFRSVRHDLRDERAERQIQPNDPRVTPVGRIIRRASLDELPQLFNVLAGEMSLVGPRPHSAHMKTGDMESARLIAEYAHRHRIKPGMTGWAAIHGSIGPLKRQEDVRRRVAWDIDYIERQSFWLDIYIMLMTPACLIRAARGPR